eukprot:jgi/Undpi1/297/HiC_scaffold_1.g00293.m1
MDYFGAGAASENTKTNVQGDRQVDDRQKGIYQFSKDGYRAEAATLMGPGMPAQIGYFTGKLHDISKSAASNIISKFAPGSSTTSLANELPQPHMCSIDMATIIRPASPKPLVDNGRWLRLRTWKAYAAHLVQTFIWSSCARDGTLVGEVVMCFDERKNVPPIKAIAHAVRFNSGTTGSNDRAWAKGKRRPTYAVRNKKKARSDAAPLWSRAQWTF